jgi:hypothetical protein
LHQVPDGAAETALVRARMAICAGLAALFAALGAGTAAAHEPWVTEFNDGVTTNLGAWGITAAGAELPVGATFDTRRGAVSLRTAGCRGRLQTGKFGGGLFTLRQPRSACGRVDIYLRGGSFKSCRHVGSRPPGAQPVRRRRVACAGCGGVTRADASGRTGATARPPSAARAG